MRLSDAVLSGADLAGRDMVGIDLQGATLVEATLRGARLHGGCLRGADLRRVRADELQGRDLDLELSSLAEASLRGALLSLAILLDADLRGADLRGANLRGADLRGADLRGADLRDANLANADLTGARIAGAQLDGVLAARACLNRVEDPDGHALEALLAAGGYAGLPPALVQAGQVTGRAGRGAGRLARSLGARISGSTGSVRRAFSSGVTDLRSGFAERAEAARERQEERDAAVAERQARWARLREQRETDRARRIAERQAQRASESALAAARRLRQTGSTARLVDPVVRPSSVREGGALPGAPMTPDAMTAERARLHADPVLVEARAAATRRIEARRAAVVERIAQQQQAAAARREAAGQAAAAALAAAEQAEIEAADAAVRGRIAEQAHRREAARQEQLAAEAEARRVAAAAREAEAREDARRDREARRRAVLARLEGAGLADPIPAAERLSQEAQALREQRDGSRGAPSERRRPAPLDVRQQLAAAAGVVGAGELEAASPALIGASAEVRYEVQRLSAALREARAVLAEKAALAAEAARTTEAAAVAVEEAAMAEAAASLHALAEARTGADATDAVAAAAVAAQAARRAEAEAEAAARLRDALLEAVSAAEEAVTAVALELATAAGASTEAAGASTAAEDAPTPTDVAPEAVAAPPAPASSWRPWARSAAAGRGVPQGSGLDLQGRSFRQQRLGAVDWHRADLRQADLLGARLAGADLREADLTEANLEGARLSRARLDGLDAGGANLAGVRMKGASLRAARLLGAQLVDADLRGADLTEADLTGADLTGADLRRALLGGASLRDANLTAARLSDLDLSGVQLDGANLDQADLAGVQWQGVTVRDADLSGALGLSGRERRLLAERGARTGEQGLQDLLGGLRSTQVRAALVILGLGMSAWLGARFLASSTGDPEVLAEEAATLRSDDPLAAAEAYEALARMSLREEERVGYLVEAALLADEAGQPDRAGALLDEALAEAGSSPGISADVRVRKATRHLDREEWAAAREAALPLLGLEGHPAETRARAVLVWQDATAGLENLDPAAVAAETEDPVEALVAVLSEVPEATADLWLALAELRSARGETELAIEAVALAGALSLPPSQRRRIQETRARVLDRGGELDDAAAIYTELAAAPDLSGPRAAMARLALADIRQRQGRVEDALGLVGPLAGAADGTASVRGRALLLLGRLEEQREGVDAAMRAYRSVLGLDGLDADTQEEARISLARVLLDDSSGRRPDEAVADLPPEAAATVLAHARLGEARTRMGEGDAEAALAAYDAVAQTADLPEDLSQAARAGKAEALASLGELAEATEIWRALLSEDPDPSERAEIELQLAQGLLQGNELEEAADAFASLAKSSEPDVRYRGLLGQAGVARVQGERARARDLYQRVADRAPDPAYQVQALQELADLATAADRPEEALQAWRALLGIVPPAHPAAGPARLAVMLGLADLDRLDEALTVCDQAVATTSGMSRLRAQAACAELLERADEPASSHEIWRGLVEEPSLPTDLAADAWLGAGRTALALGRAAEAAALASGGLDAVSATPLRLPLLSLRVEALRASGDPEDLSSAIEARDALIASAPALAGPLLVDQAAEARSSGRPDDAVALLKQAAELPLTPDERAGVLVELGDTLLEAGEVGAAQRPFARALEVEGLDDETRFAAEMGIAETVRRRGDADAALGRLDDIEPPDGTSERWWLETRAGLLSETERLDDALATWRRLIDLSEDEPASRTTALRGAADALVALDRPEEALEFYEEAARLATEPAAVGWARLGAAWAHVEAGRSEDAMRMLDGLTDHVDPEVAMQAALTMARVHSDAEDWDAVLGALEGVEAKGLGPGWDASVVETRAAALAASDQLEVAASEWRALAERWPASDEALMPAWLGLADLARMAGDLDEAREWAERALQQARDPGYRGRAADLVAALDRQ